MSVSRASSWDAEKSDHEASTLQEAPQSSSNFWEAPSQPGLVLGQEPGEKRDQTPAYLAPYVCDDGDMLLITWDITCNRTWPEACTQAWPAGEAT